MQCRIELEHEVSPRQRLLLRVKPELQATQVVRSVQALQCRTFDEQIVLPVHPPETSL